MSRSPIVIVGAGFGGLTAAVELAARGESVVVVERELTPGGKARAVDVGGRRIDVGPTVLTMPWVFEELWARAGRTFRADVRLHEATVVARHAFADGSRLDLFRDVEQTARAIETLCGSEDADGYLRFAAHGKRIAETVHEPFLQAQRPSMTELFARASRLGLAALGSIDAHRTMWKALRGFFRDPRLLALFGRYATYVGSSPFQAPGTFNLIAHVEREGVATIDGGMSQLAAALRDLALSLGVAFRFGAHAREVIVQNGRAAGVVVEQDGARDTLPASAVLLNADVSTVASGALGPTAARAVRRTPPDRRSLSAITWAVVAETRGFPLVHHNVFFSGDYPAEHEALFGSRVLPSSPTTYVCAQDRPGHDAPAPAGAERLFVIVNAPADGDAGHTREEIERCERSMLAVVGKAGLQVEIEGVVRTTPSAFERLAPGTGGALYGEAAHGAFSPMARPSSRTKIPGLYLAGGSVHPGPGVPMASLSGSLSASAIRSDLPSTTRSPTVAMAGSTSTP